MIIPATQASLLLSLQREVPREEAWTAFHARYHDVILAWCRRRELSHACAEDVTQEIWLKLIRELPSYDVTKGRFRSWLKAVVNNALTDCWRRQQRVPVRAGVGGSAFLERLVGFASPEVDELTCAIEQRADTTAAEVLARVRERLHEKTWQAFYQTLVEQRPAKDVARDLGLSVATVYKDTYRVKQMLHKEHLHVQANGNVLSGHDDSAAVPAR